MRQILLTGVTRQLGQELQRALVPLGNVVATERRKTDLLQPARIWQIIREVKPDMIVNAAAYTAVDKVETETEIAQSINAVTPLIIAEEAQRLGVSLVHISTDYVFEGQKNTPYTEKDTPNPLSIYGQFKLMGEEGIRQTCDRHTVLRTAWVYGTYGKSNFVKTMLRLGAERNEIRVVADQDGTPTWAKGIAQTITQLLLKYSLEIAGTYHSTNSGVASWYDFAVAIFEEAKQLGFLLKVQRLIPITTAEYPTPAQRPAYSVLSRKKISPVLGAHPPHRRQRLRQMLEEFYNYTYNYTYESNYSQRW